MSIDNSTIEQARNTDLASYLISKGVPLIKQGNGVALVEHDSLSITGNLWFWRSRKMGGNTLDYLQKVEGMTFIQAIAELTGEKGGQLVPFIPPVHQEPKVLVMPTKGDDVKRVWAYLMQTRKISHLAVKLCFDKHLIYQDTNGNTVFRMTDSSGQVVGAEVVGTSQQRYKGIAGGSKYGYGFNITIGAEPARMCVFESATDLLSFISLKGEQLSGRVLVSMAGLKEQTLVNMAKIHNIPLDRVCCCVDQDEAGRQFAEDMRVKHGTKTYLPPVEPMVKDWNDVLRRF